MSKPRSLPRVTPEACWLRDELFPAARDFYKSKHGSGDYRGKFELNIDAVNYHVNTGVDAFGVLTGIIESALSAQLEKYSRPGFIHSIFNKQQVSREQKFEILAKKLNNNKNDHHYTRTLVAVLQEMYKVRRS